MSHFLKCLLVLLVVTITLTFAGDFCVLQPVLTSPVSCPICNSIYENKIRSQSEQVSSQASRSLVPIYEETLSMLNTPVGRSRRRIQYAGAGRSTRRNHCDCSYKYRTIDGSCNNLLHPTWGKSYTYFTRILPPHYSDNKYLPRVAKNGESLPLARSLSTSFFQDLENPDTISLVAMAWGQFVAHDITFSVPTDSSSSLNCCGPDAQIHPDKCMPILIPKNDYFYSQHNVTCLKATRAKFAWKNGYAEQINSVTHVMDASHIYGSNLEMAFSIREFQGGKLRVQTSVEGKEFLPNMISKTCQVKKPSEPCYLAGDTRANQNPDLISLHTLLLREHNRVVEELQKLHPEWDDETLYQEGRAIVIAQFQHITYGEWLVYYIGENNMKKFNLFPQKNGYTEYDCSINPMTINSFTTTAFRAGHTGIPGMFSMLDYDCTLQRNESIIHWLNRPSIIQENGNYDQILMGMINQPMNVFGPHSSEQIKNHMFSFGAPYGSDLNSIDIERGRDHGLRPYIYYLEVCTGFKPETFEDLERYIPDEFISKLKHHYNAIEDIDLHIGGISEIKVRGTRFGPTFLCLLTEQFYRKKWGDRFWYEVEGQAHSFSEDQLQQIRKTSLSRLICDHTEITKITRDSFLPPSASNDLVDCSCIDKMDLSEWD